MQKGDFVEIEYVGRVKLTGEIFDLTSEELAKQKAIYNPNHPYGPALVVIGSNMVVQGVMKELESMEINEEREFDVLPSEGFGIRNPKLIRVVSIAKFTQNKINPIPGEYFEIDGMQARVQSVSGGRVRIDFNNPLASKTLAYNVKILRKIDNTKDKVEKLLKYYRIVYKEVEVKAKEVVIKSDKPISPVAKKMLNDMIKMWIKEIEKINFKEKLEKVPTKEKPKSGDEKK